VIQPAFNFFLNAIWVPYGFSQIYQLLHPFNGFIPPSFVQRRPVMSPLILCQMTGKKVAEHWWND
jgi:hypothetical protein